jgi:hypothetical protein
MGFVFGYQNAHAIGIHERAMRAMNPDAGRGERDSRAREVERQRVVSSFEFIPPGYATALNPTGITPHALTTAAGLHVHGNVGLSFDGEGLHRVSDKIVRGLFAWETEILLPREAAVDTKVLLPEHYKVMVDSLGSAFLGMTHRTLPPGVWYSFGRIQDDPMGSLLFVCLWERLLIMGTTCNPVRWRALEEKARAQ